MNKTLQDQFMQALQPVQPSLERYALHLTHNRSDARELVADTIASAFERFNSLKEKQAFLSFLLTIATRKWRQTRATNRRFDGTAPESFDILFSTEASAEVRTDVNLLYQAIAKLPSEQHQAIVLFEVLGFSIHEIAGIQNSTSVAVKVRLHRARKRLRTMLTDPSESVKPLLEVTI